MPILVFTGSLTRPMPQYGAANGRGLTCLSMDDATGQLMARAETGGIDDTAWLVLDAQRNVLFTTHERAGSDQSWLAAYHVDPSTGNLSEINSQPALGGEACHASLSVDRRFLFVANYNGATPPGWPEASVAVLPVGDDGRLGQAVCSARHHGKGPNAARQTTAHAHCVVPSPDGRMVYVVDLGIDRIVAYDLGTTGQLTASPASDFSLPPGLGPRHIVFSADGLRLFMVSELVPTVMSFAVDPANGALSEIDCVAIPPAGDTIVQPSGIVLSADGRFLFVALRVCNEIMGLAIDAATGKLASAGRWPSGGATPRDLAFSPSGDHLVVANQDSDRLSVFAVDRRRGTLSSPGQQQPVGTPMAIKIAVF